MKDKKSVLMKNIISLLVFIAVGSFIACEQKGNRQVNNNNSSDSSSNVGNARVASAPPGATASLIRNVYIVFDDSGSMGERYRNTTRMAAAKSALETLVQNAPADVNFGLYVLNQGDLISLVAPEKNLDDFRAKLQANRQQLVEAVRNLRPSGGTPLGASIAVGAARLAHQRELQLGYGEFRLVVVTDGESGDDLNYGVDKAKRERLPIYTIGLATGSDHSLKPHSVSFAEANEPAQLVKALKETLAELPDFTVSDFNEKK